MLVLRCVALVLAFALLASVHADPPSAPPEASPYGDTYTPEELAALDRLLHAGNMNRADLTFRKDMARGHACFPIVREMLRDPLLIAPVMDRVAAAATSGVLTSGILRAALKAAVEAGRPAKIDEKSPLFGGEEEPERPAEAGGVRFDPPPVDPPRGPASVMLLLRSALDTGVAQVRPIAGGPDESLGHLALRRRLLGETAMREGLVVPERAEVEAKLSAFLKEHPSYLHEAASRLDLSGASNAWLDACSLLQAIRYWPKEAFPTDKPLIEGAGAMRIAVGTRGDDVYTGDFAAILDPGGNDRYENGHFASARPGRPEEGGDPDVRVGLLIDLAGDDVYDCRGVDLTLGAAYLGVAALVDLGQGNDRYAGGHLSLGAAVGGVGVLYDDGGSDTYQGKTFTQGAAGFGIGILYDDAVGEPPQQKTDEGTKDPIEIATWDNDRLSAWCCAQAFARTKGVALCINTRGNEVYEAGGVYLHAPLFADRYQSFSQGFAIGTREIDYAGGLAMLIDRAGNDRYLGDIYNQGAGYWYAAGLLWDGGGNDVYEMTQYGQGSGIHLAVGGLVDVSGSDAYLMHSGLGQGSSHDFAASVLHDRGGNDRYHGNTSCNGCGLTNSVGLFLDRSGDDTYAARRDGGLNAGRPARGFGSVGLFVDLGGKDDYLGPQKDEAQWRDSDVGLGIDVKTSPAVPGGAGGTSEPNQVTGKAEIPPVVKHEGPLTQAVFDELWAIAIRWEVGDNRVIVPEARKRLVAFGKGVLPLLDGKMADNDTGLALRAHVDILKALSDAGASADVLDLLRKNAASEVEQRRKTALMLIGELKAKEAEAAVVSILEGQDPVLSRRAAGVLLALGSHAGDERLKTWLTGDDEPRVLAALGTLLGLDSDVDPAVRGLLAHPLVTVRTRLATLLAEHKATYGAALLEDLVGADLPDRAKRTALDAIARNPMAPTREAVARVRSWLLAEDWGVRADAVRALRAWLAAKDADKVLLEGVAEALAHLRSTEKDSYVLSQLAGLDVPAPPQAK